jgi:two-component system NarL family sensor kinase
MLLEGYKVQHCSADTASIIDTAIRYLRKGVEDGSRAIRGIRPAVLDDLGLEAAVEDLIDQFSKLGLLVTLSAQLDVKRLPESIQTTVYRVVQEALNNAKKHSGADAVQIELHQAAGKLHLEIQDFGCGFDVDKARPNGFGLRGMIERVRLHGGECTIKSNHGAGTCVIVDLAVPRPTEYPRQELNATS